MLNKGFAEGLQEQHQLLVSYDVNVPIYNPMKAQVIQNLLYLRILFRGLSCNVNNKISAFACNTAAIGQIEAEELEECFCIVLSIWDSLGSCSPLSASFHIAGYNKLPFIPLPVSILLIPGPLTEKLIDSDQLKGSLNILMFGTCNIYQISVIGCHQQIYLRCYKLIHLACMRELLKDQRVLQNYIISRRIQGVYPVLQSKIGKEFPACVSENLSVLIIAHFVPFSEGAAYSGKDLDAVLAVDHICDCTGVGMFPYFSDI